MRLGSIAGGLIGLHAGGVEGMVEGEVLGALAVRSATAASARPHEGARGEHPRGRGSAILVIEHHWAASLRDAIADAGGFS